jgi:hypothetical protein
VAAAGDVNGDGYGDILVGAPLYESSKGKVYLYLGSENGPRAVPDWTYVCESPDSTCGYALSTAGDANQDGYNDILIGAPAFDSPETNEGAVLFFFGWPGGPTDTPDWITEGDQQEAWFGVSVAGGGDVDGDGYDDILIGSSLFDRDEDHPDLGAAFLYLGSPAGPANQPRWRAFGSESYAGFGRSVQLGGDFNQDGFDDILVGAYKYGQNGEDSQPDEGAAYLFAGSRAGAWPTPNWAVYGEKAETEFGFSVASAGDVDGDAGTDILIGAPLYKYDEKTVMGRAFLYLDVLSYLNYSYVFIPFILNQ